MKDSVILCITPLRICHCVSVGVAVTINCTTQDSPKSRVKRSMRGTSKSSSNDFKIRIALAKTCNLSPRSFYFVHVSIRFLTRCRSCERVPRSVARVSWSKRMLIPEVNAFRRRHKTSNNGITTCLARHLPLVATLELDISRGETFNS